MNRKQKMTAILAVAALLFIAAAGTGGCSRSAGEIRFADVGWDSVKFHRRIRVRIHLEGGARFLPDYARGHVKGRD